MIKISNVMGNYITIEGHADYRETNDIVCASVSSIMYTTVNAILNFNENAIDFVDNNKICTIGIKSHDEITTKLIENMMMLFNSLAKDYPANIEIRLGGLK